MILIDRENTIHNMTKENIPASHCNSGDIVAFHTYDCYCNKLLPNDARLGVDNPPLNNPATGPLYIEGAELGDTLKVEILDIQVGDVGICIIGPSSKSLSKVFEKYQIKRYCIKDGFAIISDELSLPVKPMIGVIGVAPQEPSIPTSMAGIHGGNMDCTQIRKGAVLYLPVFTDGALLSIGDLHALMGDGEISEGGLEIEGTAVVKVSVLKGVSRRAPVIFVDGKWITIATCKTLDEAAEEATGMMLDFLMNEVGMDAEEAVIVTSLSGNLAVCQKCAYYNTMRMELAYECFCHTGFKIP